MIKLTFVRIEINKLIWKNKIKMKKKKKKTIFAQNNTYLRKHFKFCNLTVRFAKLVTFVFTTSNQKSKKKKRIIIIITFA